jgi:hypothetical protein
VDEDNIVLDGPALHYEQHVKRDGDLVITTTLRAIRESVSIAEVPDHLAALNEMRDRLDVTIEPLHASRRPWIYGIGFGVLAILLTVAFAIRRRNRAAINGNRSRSRPVGPSLA